MPSSARCCGDSLVLTLTASLPLPRNGTTTIATNSSLRISISNNSGSKALFIRIRTGEVTVGDGTVEDVSAEVDALAEVAHDVLNRMS
jgi:hypothetical protein